MEYFSPVESQQQQDQRQRQQEQQQPYDLSQSHLHDAYYGYYQQRSYDASASHDQYYYSYYYPHEHAASHYHHQHPAAAQLDSSSTPALLRDASPGIQHRGSGGASVVPGDAQDPRASYPAPQGLNPAAAAAVAALSQLVQFAGTMDAAERTGAGGQERWQQGVVDPGMRSHVMPPPQHPYEYPTQPGGMRQGAGGRGPNRVGGRSGGPFRGRGNGNKAGFGRRPPRSDGRAPFRGRGRGACIIRGGGRHSHQFTPELPSDTAANESITQPESAETQVSRPAPVLPQQPVLPLAWCDICRVGCNSLEILEQHKNGKRHKKTVQRLEEIQAQQKLLSEAQVQPCMQGFDGRQTQPQHESQEKVIKPADGVIQEAKLNNIVQVGEEIKTSAISENLQEVLTGENMIKTESEVQAVVKQSEGPKTDGYDGKNPPKRKAMRFGRGGKRLRTCESICRKQSRPKEQPRVCTLCNVICDTQAVFDSHVAGKKHSSRIKRFQGQAVYGPLNVYIPPNQPSMYDPSGPQPLYFGLQSQETVPLTAYEPQLLLSETYGPSEQQQGGQTMSMPQIEHLGVPQDVEDQNAASASEVMDAVAAGVAPGNTVLEAEAAFASTKDSETALKTGDAVEVEAGSATEEGSILDAEDAITAKDIVVKAETSFTSGVDIPTPDYGVASAENVIPGLDIIVQESSAKNETGNQDTSSH